MRQRWAALAVGLAVVVVGASLLPASGGDSLPPNADKLLHLAGYAAIAFAAGMSPRPATDRALVAVLLGVVALGAVVEVVQPTVGRTASGLDAVANLAGAAVGVLVARRRRRAE